VPGAWKFGMVILVVCLVASMGIAIFRLATTPTEILGDGFRNLPAGYQYERADGSVIMAGPKAKHDTEP
jgi:hypothetical protein